MRRLLSINRAISDLFLFASVCMVIPYYVDENSIGVLVATVLLIVAFVPWCVEFAYERLVCLIFVGSVFVFLLSGLLANAMEGIELVRYFSDKECFDSIILIYLSLFVVFLCCRVTLSSKRIKHFNYANYLPEVDSSTVVRRALLVCKMVFYLGAVCEIIMLVVRIVLVQNVGYVGSYLEISSVQNGVPGIIVKFSDFYICSFIIMLALLPEIKEIKKEILIYMLISFMSLFTGARNGFFVPLVFLIWFFSYRKSSGLSAISLPFKLSFTKLVVIGYIASVLIGIIGLLRMNLPLSATVFNPIRTIADNIGGSNYAIMRTFSIEDRIPDDMRVGFLFGPFKNLFNNNIISQVLFNTKIDPYGTVAYAMNGNNFGSYLTYVYDPAVYSSGGGFGSCYIAEAYVAWKYLGVILISVFYSIFMGFTCRIRKGNWIKRAILFYMLYWFFYTPRDAALYFITAGFNITNIFLLAIVYLYAKAGGKK